MSDKDFVVKNGLSVNGAVFVVNTGSNSVGVNTSSPDATLKVTGTANVTGNVTFSANLTVSGNVYANLVGSVTGNLTGNVVGTANNANNLGALPPSAYALANTIQANSATAYQNATAFSANATNLTSGTVNTSLLPATINIGTALNIGANVSVNTSTISIGNSTVNFIANSSTISGAANATFNIISGNGVNVTSVNAAAVGGNTAATLRSYTDTVAANAYSNATAYADNKAANAYSNAVAAVPSLTSNATTYVLGGGSVTTNTFTIGTAAYYASNGNFGLGTSAPGYKLDANGTIRVTGTSPGGDALVVRSANSTSFMTFKPEAIANLGYFGYYSGSGFTTVYTPAGFSVGGSVGVGTTSPAQSLDVRGTTVSNTYTSQGIVTLTDGATITCDTTQGNFFQVKIGRAHV